VPHEPTRGEVRPSLETVLVERRAQRGSARTNIRNPGDTTLLGWRASPTGKRPTTTVGNRPALRPLPDTSRGRADALIALARTVRTGAAGQGTTAAVRQGSTLRPLGPTGRRRTPTCLGITSPATGLRCGTGAAVQHPIASVRMHSTVRPDFLARERLTRGVTTLVRLFSSTYLPGRTIPTLQQTTTPVQNDPALRPQTDTGPRRTTALIRQRPSTAGLGVQTLPAGQSVPTLVRNQPARCVELHAGLGNALG
jgi:hypothetical protein